MLACLYLWIQIGYTLFLYSDCSPSVIGGNISIVIGGNTFIIIGGNISIVIDVNTFIVSDVNTFSVAIEKWQESQLQSR